MVLQGNHKGHLRLRVHIVSCFISARSSIIASPGNLLLHWLSESRQESTKVLTDCWAANRQCLVAGRKEASLSITVDQVTCSTSSILTPDGLILLTIRVMLNHGTIRHVPLLKHLRAKNMTTNAPS